MANEIIAACMLKAVNGNVNEQVSAGRKFADMTGKNTQHYFHTITTAGAANDEAIDLGNLGSIGYLLAINHGSVGAAGTNDTAYVRTADGGTDFMELEAGGPGQLIRLPSTITAPFVYSHASADGGEVQVEFFIIER